MKLGLAVFVLLLALWQAEAATFTATITSGFSGCAGAASPVYQPTTQSACTYSASSSLAYVRWGVPATNGGQRSGLQFEPPTGTITLNTDTDTYIGKLTHFNFPLSDATYDNNPSKTEIPSVVRLGLAVKVNLPSGATTFTPQFPLQVQETKNDATPLSGSPPTCQQAIDNPDWNLPAQGISGWNSGLPCCPYGSTIRCSDKITFNSLLDVSSEFEDGTSRYTLQLQGFKDVQSPTGAAVNKFISQEQQNSVAYLYARLTVKCTGDTSCTISPQDVAKQCRVGSCNAVSGVCVYNANAGLNGANCPLGITNPHPLCQKPVCSSGECILSTIAGSEGQFCNSSDGGRPPDSCTIERCNGGICKFLASASSPNCTDQSAGVATYAPCTEQRCVNNKCTLKGLENRACVPIGVTYDSRCSRGSCKKKTLGGIEVGTCTLKRTNTGNAVDQASCTTPASGQACKWVQCEPTSGYPKGSCTYSFITPATSCGATPGECQTRTCDGSGNCVLANKANSVACTGIPAATCKDRKCDGSGTCSYYPQANTVSCTSLPDVACKDRKCDGAGTCSYYNQANTATCTSIPDVACKNRKCDGSGTCSYYPLANTVSCTSIPDVACKDRKCDGSGTCSYYNQANTATCSSLPAVACKSQKCDGLGTCEYVNEPNKVACTSITAPSSTTCMKRVCKPGAGTCTYSVIASPSGTCSSISGVSCKNRGCQGTVTTLTSGPWSKCALTSNEPDSGSCSNPIPFSAHTCYRRICQSGKCTKVANPSPSGSCTSTPTLGTASSTPVSVGAVDCKKRTCNTTTAVCTPLSDSSKDNSNCTGPTGGDCTASLCLSGACGVRNVSTGSCKNLVSVSPDPNQCIQRLCGQAGKPAGQCGLVISTGSCGNHWSSQFNSGAGLNVNRSCVDLLCAANGTCYIQLKSNGVSCGSAACLNYTCQNGQCIVSNKANGPQSTCTGTTTSCRRPECLNGVCTQNVVYNVGGSCNSISSDLCNNRLCDSAGACNYVYKNNPTQGCSGDGANSGCTVKKCGNITSGGNSGKGTCMDLSSTVTGLACGSEIPGACYLKQCVSGQCVKRADPSKADQSCEIAVHCSRKREDEDFSLSHTLVSRDLLPPLNGSSDCQVKAAEDAGCYAYRCSNGGQCKSVAVNNNVGCGPTPPNAIQNGTTFACKQYVCSAGTCNTNAAATVDILEGEFCSGFSPCDPTSDGCNDECQTYVCHSGLCELDLREGETCDYPKRPTYRRAERDEILVPTECQESRCRGGRCALWTIEDGTGCGDRQNNSCANDTCVSGQCVTSETNCSHIEAPSVCFDVTCDPSTGECGLKLNGVVDCTCIGDCSSCTKVNRLVNESAQAQETDSSVLQNGACWWCPDAEQPGCYNRINFETGEVVYYEDPVTGERTEKPDPSCVSSEDECGGSSDLTGGEIAGIVVAAVAVAAIAAVALGAAALLARFLQASSTAGEDAILTDVAFESNAADNPFHQSKWTQSDLVGSIAADAVPSAHFVTN